MFRPGNDEDIRPEPVQLVAHRPLHRDGEGGEGDERPDPDEDPEACEYRPGLPPEKVLPGQSPDVHLPSLPVTTASRGSTPSRPRGRPSGSPGSPHRPPGPKAPDCIPL